MRWGWLWLVIGLGGCVAPRQLWFGGDVFLGSAGAERLLEVAVAMRPAQGVVNLEGPIGAEAGESEARLINGPRTATALAQAGVVAAGIDNNHGGDLGADGRAKTRAALEAVGVRPFGVTVLELRGLKLALTAHDLTGGVPKDLASQLAAARASAQALIATFHVTGPPSLLPSAELKEAVEVALAAGAVVVIGHGSHAIAAVERRGAAVIAWGLGNLSFECACTDEADGLVLGIELDEAGKVTRATAVPIAVGLRGANAALSADPKLVLDLLESLGSKLVRRSGGRAEF